jgi:hypothetical protein
VPTSLADAVEVYCHQSLEDEGRLKAPPATDGDLGLDVVNWLSFADNRGGFLHFIGQCASGADWSDKLPELNPDKWGDHISWAVRPVRFFATPFVVPTPDFRRASKDGGLVLDRPRLMELAKKRPLSAAVLNLVRDYTGSLYN